MANKVAKKKKRDLDFIITGYHGRQPKGIRSHALIEKIEYEIDEDKTITNEQKAERHL